MIQAIVPGRSTKKYHQRGWRFAQIEVGLATQTLLLVATAMQLGSVVSGGYFDDEVERLIDVDGAEETVANLIILEKLEDEQNGR